MLLLSPISLLLHHLRRRTGSPPALSIPVQPGRRGRRSGGSGWEPAEQIPSLLPPPAAVTGSPRGQQLLGMKGANHVAKLSPRCNWPAAAAANEGLVQGTQMSLPQRPLGNALSALRLHLNRETQGTGMDLKARIGS